jgi:hypothetical protein
MGLWWDHDKLKTEANFCPLHQVQRSHCHQAKYDGILHGDANQGRKPLPRKRKALVTVLVLVTVVTVVVV